MAKNDTKTTKTAAVKPRAAVKRNIAEMVQKDTLGVRRPAHGFAAADTATAAKSRRATKVAEASGSNTLKAVRTPAVDPARQIARVVTPAVTGIPEYRVVNIGQLCNILATFPHGSKFNTERKFGIPIIEILNIRGRKVADIKLVTKPIKFK